MRALITTDTVGGVWTFTEELTKQLIARGWAVRLVSLGGAPSVAQEAWRHRMEAAHGASFWYDNLEIQLEWMLENDRAYSAAAPLLTQMAEEFGARILHANQFCFGALPLDIPIVVTGHSDVLSWARGCGKVLEDSAWLRTYCGLVTRGLADSAAVVAPTRWMAQSLQRDFVLTRTPIVIANGRSLHIKNQKQRKLQAVTAGRLWDEAKNIELLTRIESPMPLLIAGPASVNGPAAFQGSAHVAFLGPLAPDELHDLFRESSLYICPSRYEPFGLAALEAAQCGCAILANDIPPLREVWEYAALYFRDAASLTALLRRISDNPHELQAAQLRAGRRAQVFTAERVGSAYHDLFQRLIHHAEQENALCQVISA